MKGITRILGTAIALLLVSQAHAALYLKQSTASQAVKFGPFVDSTDGNTEETALTIANTDIKCSKNGGVLASKNSGGGTHDANGWYTVTFDATDTNTVGRLQCYVHVSGALPVYEEFNVVEEAIYDELFGASALGYIANAPVNVAQFGGTNGTFASGRPEVNVTHAAGTAWNSGAITESTFATTAGSFKPLGVLDQGTAQSATGTTLVLRSAASFADDTPIGMTIVACGSTQGYCQSRSVTDYVGSTDTATVDTWTVTPSGTITYYLFGTAPSSGTALDAAGVRAAIGLASANLDTQLSTIDDYVDTEVAAIKTKTDFLPSATAGAAGGVFIAGTNAATTITTALTTTFTGNLTGSVGSVTGNVGGNLTGSVGSVATGGITAASIATDAIGAAEIASDAGTEIGTAVWASTTRLLTAGTNIVLAKGTGVTGFNDPTTAAVAGAVWDEAQSGHVIAGTFGAYLDSSVSGVSTGGVSAADIADAVWDEATSGHATAGTYGIAVSDVLTRMGTPSNLGGGATLSANLSDIESQTDDIGAAGAGLTAIPWNSAWDASVTADALAALNSLTISEPAAKPSWSSSTLAQWIAWIGAWTRNEVNQTSTQKILRNDADSANIVTCSVSDDGTTFAVQECSP